MLHKYILLSVLTFTLLCGGGCKKQTAQTPPRRYQPRVDAIAARPLPAIDSAQAQRILRDGAISPTQDISTGEFTEPETPVTPSTPALAPTPGTTPDFNAPTTTPAPAPTQNFGWGGSSDPNSF